jgi:hypothetical protein
MAGIGTLRDDLAQDGFYEARLDFPESKRYRSRSVRDDLEKDGYDVKLDLPEPATLIGPGGGGNGPRAARLDRQIKWENDLPLKFLWTIKFSARDGQNNALGNRIEKVIKMYEARSTGKWPVQKDIIERQSHSKYGYLFATAVAFPGDSFAIMEQPFENTGGFIPAYVGGQRTGYGSGNKLDITFFETNKDILDYFIRPWIIANSHLGLIELGEGNPTDIKCHIQVCFYTRDKASYERKNEDAFSGNVKEFRTVMQLRKSMQFYNCVPFNIAGDQISYGELSFSDVSKIVSFAFSHYEIDNIENMQR